MAQIVNRKQAASHCGVSLPTFDVWIQKGCPFVRRGSKGKEWKFDLRAVTAWRDRYCAKPKEVVARGAAVELESREQAAVVSAVGNLIARVGQITAEMTLLAGASIETAYAAEQLVTIKLSEAADRDLEGRGIASLDLMAMFCLIENECDWSHLAKQSGQTFDDEACEKRMDSLSGKW